MKELLKTIKPKRLYEEIVQQIQDLIRQGTLKSGDRLPSERELAERFQVSRSSLREAIRVLELQGIVVSQPGAGTFISTSVISSLESPIASRLIEGQSALRDILELHLLLEPHIAALGAERATIDNVRRMAESLQQQERQIARGETGVKGDTAFHLAIAQATQNSVLEQVLTIITDILHQHRSQSLQTPSRPERSLESHRHILQMILQRDIEGAREAMAHHISMVEPIVLAEDPKSPMAAE